MMHDATTSDSSPDRQPTKMVGRGAPLGAAGAREDDGEAVAGGPGTEMHHDGCKAAPVHTQGAGTLVDNEGRSHRWAPLGSRGRGSVSNAKTEDRSANRIHGRFRNSTNETIQTTR